MSRYRKYQPQLTETVQTRFKYSKHDRVNGVITVVSFLKSHYQRIASIDDRYGGPKRPSNALYHNSSIVKTPKKKSLPIPSLPIAKIQSIQKDKPIGILNLGTNQ
jgi:hypothetical protein